MLGHCMTRRRWIVSVGTWAEGGLAFQLPVLALCLAVGIGLAMLWGADTMWDLRSYHLFNAFSFAHGRIDTDVAPVGHASYVTPFPDLPFYWLYTAFGPRAAHVLLGAWYGLLIHVVLLLNRRIFAEALPASRLAALLLLPLCATVIGVTGAAALGQAATTTNEVQAATLVLAALLLALPVRGATAARAGAVLAGGVLIGIAVGVKLTAGVYLVAGIVMLLPWRLEGPEIRRLALFGAGAIAGIVASYGAWGWTLFAKFGNPLFPFYNGIFRSPATTIENFADRRFLPQTALEAILYPATWAFEPARRTSELLLRDPRLLLLLVLAVGLAAVQIAIRPPGRPLGRTMVRVLVFGLVAYLVWLAQFSILRYAIPIEAIAGTLVVMGVLLVLRRPVAASLGAAAAAAALLLWSQVPDWGRIPFEVAYTVSIDPVPDGSVVLLVGQPVAYIAALMPGRDLTFAGVNWWTTGDPPARRALVEFLDRGSGDAWAIVMRGQGAESLLDGLGWTIREADCTPVRTAIDPTGIDLCPVRRGT